MAETETDLVPLSGSDPIDGLLDRSAWVSEGGMAVLTWSPHNDAGTWSASELIQVRAALASWANVANIEFVEISAAGTYHFSSADIAMVATGDQLVLLEDSVGLAFLPFYDPRPTPLMGENYTVDQYPHPEGDIFIDDPGTGAFTPGSDDFATLVHEIGHALGLKHPHSSPRSFSQLGLASKDTSQWTVMSYETTPGATLLEGWPITPMPYDILAIQYLYGANMSYRTGDDVYVLEADGAWRTLWDAGGVDTLDGSGLANGTTITLVEGAFTYHGARSATAIAFDAVIENAIGTSGDDVLRGNNVGNELTGGAGKDELIGSGGADELHGGSGADFLKGGAGADSLFGDGGRDRFYFSAKDLIVDGGNGLDRLDLTGGNQTLDLLLLDDARLTGMEIISLTGTGNNTLILNVAEALAISSTLDTLRIMGNAGDSAQIGSGWSEAADVSIGGQLYHQYIQGDAVLLIDADISVLM